MQIENPDCIWPTDNEYGVPCLSSFHMAQSVELPVCMWGELARSNNMFGTWGFYVDDYRFSALWKSPDRLIRTKCRNVIEPNFSLTDQIPFAIALWHIYRKRWLARYWQEYGSIGVFVDLNVGIRYAELNMMGVPEGWRSFATRAYKNNLYAVLDEYEIAYKRRGGNDLLFLVYGGGKEAEELCKQYKFIWMPDRQTAQKERRLNNG